jgi:UDP-glucuronate decarboxylase
MINMLELARKLEVPLLQASTSEVYGDAQISPQSETYWGNVNPIGLRACYDEGKRAAETLCFDYSRQFGTRIKIVRIFNTYGPKMAIDDGRVVSNFIVSALRGEDLTVYGDGTQTRSLCYIDDLIQGILKFFFDTNHSGPVNIGNTEEISMINLANLIINLTNSSSSIKHEPLPMDDPKQRRPSLELINSLVNWEPNFSVETGLRKTIDYFKHIA